MLGQGKKPGKAKRTFYVLSLEIECVHLAGGIRTVTVVWSVSDVHAVRQNI